MATKPASTLHSFYRPHARVTEDGRVVNPVTGEITYPPSMTKQEFKAECDINNIIKQFSATGMLRHISSKASTGSYQDLPESVDFQDALNTVHAGQAAFATLPSKVRSRFGNDPAEFLIFLNDPANEPEARALGLLNPAVAAVVPPPMPTTPGGDIPVPPAVAPPKA